MTTERSSNLWLVIMFVVGVGIGLLGSNAIAKNACVGITASEMLDNTCPRKDDGASSCGYSQRNAVIW